ncbi:hypothetical protein CBW18_08425 [Pedobacter sp. AJM]|nr:hypothetical protein CBW18_08425 [Pedobacter sp. AJM]
MTIIQACFFQKSPFIVCNANVETFFSETNFCFQKKRFGFWKQIFPKQKNVSAFFVSGIHHFIIGIICYRLFPVYKFPVIAILIFKTHQV